MKIVELPCNANQYQTHPNTNNIEDLSEMEETCQTRHEVLAWRIRKVEESTLKDPQRGPVDEHFTSAANSPDSISEANLATALGEQAPDEGELTPSREQQLLDEGIMGSCDVSVTAYDQQDEKSRVESYVCRHTDEKHQWGLHPLQVQ